MPSGRLFWPSTRRTPVWWFRTSTSPNMSPAIPSGSLDSAPSIRCGATWTPRSTGPRKLGLRGVKLAPTYQGFDPLGPEAYVLYEAIAARGLPTLWHQGVTFVRKSVLAYAYPRQIDEVALRFPEMPIVIAHLGHPWIDECIAVVRKHPSVYADISALVSRPIQLRAGLITAGEYRIADKLFFGTDFPFATIRGTVDVLRGWLDDPASPAVLQETVAAILASTPLETLGL